MTSEMKEQVKSTGRKRKRGENVQHVQWKAMYRILFPEEQKEPPSPDFVPVPDQLIHETSLELLDTRVQHYHSAMLQLFRQKLEQDFSDKPELLEQMIQVFEECHQALCKRDEVDSPLQSIKSTPLDSVSEDDQLTATPSPYTIPGTMTPDSVREDVINTSSIERALLDTDIDFGDQSWMVFDPEVYPASSISANTQNQESGGNASFNRVCNTQPIVPEQPDTISYSLYGDARHYDVNLPSDFDVFTANFLGTFPDLDQDVNYEGPAATWT